MSFFNFQNSTTTPTPLASATPTPFNVLTSPVHILFFNLPAIYVIVAGTVIGLIVVVTLFCMIRSCRRTRRRRLPRRAVLPSVVPAPGEGEEKEGKERSVTQRVANSFKWLGPDVKHGRYAPSAGDRSSIAALLPGESMMEDGERDLGMPEMVQAPQPKVPQHRFSDPHGLMAPRYLQGYQPVHWPVEPLQDEFQPTSGPQHHDIYPINAQRVDTSRWSDPMIPQRFSAQDLPSQYPSQPQRLDTFRWSEPMLAQETSFASIPPHVPPHSPSDRLPPTPTARNPLSPESPYPFLPEKSPSPPHSISSQSSKGDRKIRLLKDRIKAARRG
ncbi:hypothetical protein BZG36_04868 [Bifiguratus adelaidae]|uniref:Uncharacterized protein n=1 Tax=Bifiguratus adelaidae TaxID=1938954 RepID=A0A261XUK1_9FUNG|nr:hypothetical protein BZG36_04868 [Bifiguratus adelaidae]